MKTNVISGSQSALIANRLATKKLAVNVQMRFEIHTIYINTIDKRDFEKSKAIILHPKLNGIAKLMELDTGVSLSKVNKKFFDEIKMGKKLIRTH